MDPRPRRPSPATLATNSGATSYHLRRLASVGLVEETDEGHGRERWWRATTRAHSWTPLDVAGDPDGEAAADWLSRQNLRGFVERYEAWLDELRSWSPDWQEVAGSTDLILRLSPRQAERAASANSASSWRDTRMPPSPGRTPSSSRSTSTRSPDQGARDDRPRRSRRPAPLSHPDRPALAADGAAHPGDRPPRPLARPDPDPDRPRLRHPGPRRARPRAADRRPVGRTRAAARPHRREHRRSGFAGAPVRRGFGGALRGLDLPPGRLPRPRQRSAGSLVRRCDPGRRPRCRHREGPQRGQHGRQRRHRARGARVGRPRGDRPGRRGPGARAAPSRRARAERREPRGDRRPDAAKRRSPAGSVPWRIPSGRSRRVVGDGIGLLRASRILLALVAVELFWGVASVAFERLFPIRLSEAVGDLDAGRRADGPGQLARLVRSRGRGRRRGPAQRADRRRALRGQPSGRAGRDDRGDGHPRRAGRPGDRVPRLLRGARRVEPDAHDAAPPRGQRSAPDHRAVDELDGRPAGRGRRGDPPRRPGGRDLDLDGDDRRRDRLRARCAALHPGLARRARAQPASRWGRPSPEVRRAGPDLRRPMSGPYPRGSTQPSVRSTPLCQRAIPAARVGSPSAAPSGGRRRSIARSSSRPLQKPTASPAA